MSTYLKNVVLVGAGGNLGTSVLDALLKQGKHHITVITRPTSTSTFPPGVTVKRGTYDDADFLRSAFAGQDVAINMLGLHALGDEEKLIEAAGNAGVQYILPSEFGGPSEDPAFADVVPLMASKFPLHQKIKDLGSKYIIVSTNPWFDWCLVRGTFGINLAERKATLYPDGTSWTTTSLDRVGKGIAKLLALPVQTIEEHFANRYAYLSSFHLTQMDLFAAVMKATGTTESDWEVQRSSTDEWLKESKGKFAAGDFSAMAGIIMATTFQRGDYAAKAAEHNEMLHLDDEDLVEAVKEAAEKTRGSTQTVRWK